MESPMKLLFTVVAMVLSMQAANAQNTQGQSSTETHFYNNNCCFCKPVTAVQSVLGGFNFLLKEGGIEFVPSDLIRDTQDSNQWYCPPFLFGEGKGLPACGLLFTGI